MGPRKIGLETMDGLEELCKHVGARGPGFRSTQHPRPVSPACLAHAPRLPRRRQSTAGHGCMAPVPAWRPRGRSSPRAPPSFLAAGGEAAAPGPLQEKRTKEPASQTSGGGAPHPVGSETRKRALLGCCVWKEHQPSTPLSLREKLSTDFPLSGCAPLRMDAASPGSQTGAQRKLRASLRARLGHCWTQA